jgi:HSP20 family protein
VIKGEKRLSQEMNEEKFFHREMSYGKIMREITVPEKVNQEKAKATYENGLLKITLPKADRAKTSKIELL